MERIKFAILVYVIIFVGIFSGWARSGVEIEYTPVKMLRNKSVLPLELTVSNFSGIPIREVQVWHRWIGESRFQMKQMDNEGFRYFASIDIEDNKTGLMEYYFTLTYMDNHNESYPAGAPSSRLLKTAVQVLRNYGDEIVIISPEPGEQIFNNDVLITASFASFAAMVDVEKTRLYINTWDVTNYLQKYDEFISFAPRTVPAGRHKIRLELYNDQGTLVASREWNFIAISGRMDKEVTPEGWQVTGRFFAEARQEQLGMSDNKYDFNQSGLQLRAAYQNWNFGGRIYVSNQEKSYRQPVNRYSGFARVNFWNDRYFQLDFGDNYPKMNAMVMQNIFLRGVYARLFLKAFNLEFAQGSTRRALEGRKESIETTTGNDTISVYGTFKRKITTIRPSFGSGENFQLGFTYLKGKDDDKSIDIGINPEENVAAGADLYFGLDQKRIVFEGSFGTSFYNRNIAGGTIPFDTLDSVLEGISESTYNFAKKYITINQYLVLKPGFAYQTRLLLRYFQNNLSFIYESVDEEYFSLGQPYLLRDNRGFHIVDNINLVRNQVFLTLGYRQYQNNLQNTRISTTKNKMFYGNLSYFPIGNLPEVTIGYNNYTRKNDADYLTSFETLTPTDTINIIDRPEDNKTSTFNFSGGYRFNVGNIRNRIGVDLVSYQRDDIFKISESNSNYLTVNLTAKFRFPLQTLVEFIQQNTETGQDTEFSSKLDMTTFGFGGKYIFSNVFSTDHLTLSANLRFGNVKSGYALSTLPDYSYSRNYYSIRLLYSIPRYGNFGIITDILSYGGDRSYSDFIYMLRYDINF